MDTKHVPFLLGLQRALKSENSLFVIFLSHKGFSASHVHLSSWFAPSNMSKPVCASTRNRATCIKLGLHPYLSACKASKHYRCHGDSFCDKNPQISGGLQEGTRVPVGGGGQALINALGHATVASYLDYTEILTASLSRNSYVHMKEHNFIMYRYTFGAVCLASLSSFVKLTYFKLSNSKTKLPILRPHFTE